jgi:hypothetical protein
MIEYFKRYWVLILIAVVVWAVTIFMVKHDHLTEEKNGSSDTIIYHKPNVDSLIKVKDSVIISVEHIKQEQIKKVSDIENQKRSFEKIKKDKDNEIKHIKELHKKDSLAFKENEKLKQEVKDLKRKEREYYLKQRELNDSLIILKSSMN